MISRTVAVSTPCCAAAASMAASGLPSLLVRLAWNVFAIAAKVSRAGCDSLSREVRFGDQTSVGAKERRWLRRLSSQHNPSNIFASVGIDYDEIDLSSGPFAQFVETMVVEIVIDKEPPWEGSGAMIFDLDRL
jgi:hypothetical protein